MFDRFVYREAWTFGRNLKQDAAGLAKIDRMKIKAIDHWRNVDTELGQLFAPAQLFLVVRAAKRDVMHRAGGVNSALSPRAFNQIQLCASRFFVYRKSAPRFFLLEQFEAERFK